MAWFRRGEAARAVATPIESSDLLRDEQPSLLIAGSLSQQSGDPADVLVAAPHGFVDEVGFAARWADPLSSLPPRNPAFCSNFYHDRFFVAQSGDCTGYLARLQINEQLVEDTYMRGSVDYTGFEVVVTFNPDAYALFAELVEIERPKASSSRSFVLGVPTPPFAFPAQRGSPTPGDAKIEFVKELRPIKRLEVREMIVATADRATAVASDNVSILDRYHIISATRLTLADE